jgi:hypothetical protein
MASGRALLAGLDSISGQINGRVATRKVIKRSIDCQITWREGNCIYSFACMLVLFLVSSVLFRNSCPDESVMVPLMCAARSFTADQSRGRVGRASVGAKHPGLKTDCVEKSWQLEERNTNVLISLPGTT